MYFSELVLFELLVVVGAGLFDVIGLEAEVCIVISPQFVVSFVLEFVPGVDGFGSEFEQDGMLVIAH